MDAIVITNKTTTNWNLHFTANGSFIKLGPQKMDKSSTLLALGGPNKILNEQFQWAEIYTAMGGWIEYESILPKLRCDKQDQPI